MKRTVLLILSLLLCLSILTVPVSASGYVDKITVDHIDREALGDYLGNPSINPEHTRPGDEILIPLKYEGFRNSANELIDWGRENEYGPTVQQLKSSNVGVHILFGKGNHLIRDVEIVPFTPTSRNQCYSAIRVRFVEEMPSTKEYLYEFSVQLYVKDKANGVTLEKFGGRLFNPIFEATKNDYVYVGDGTMVKSMAPIVELELGLGAGVTAFVDTSTNELYYGIAKHTDTIDDAIAKQYPEIKEIYQIRAVNIKTSNTRVKIDDQSTTDPYYVYNLAGVFVGMSNEVLPFSSTYYLSDVEITIDPNLIDPALFDDQSYIKDVLNSAVVVAFNEGLRLSAEKTVADLETIEEEPGYEVIEVEEEALPSKAPTIYFRK